MSPIGRQSTVLPFEELQMLQLQLIIYHADHPSISDLAVQAFKMFCSYLVPLK